MPAGVAATRFKQQHLGIVSLGKALRKHATSARRNNEIVTRLEIAAEVPANH
ncbi:hypothetical protein OIU34_14925 [Pararhizobium sp. BT-229]|uniref:hypothetical protein n=1 Tax=Pararhizobium sp. BT-229 TaxID=2986923 RepID=UPI0021F72B16|nr:hypothetical protein [Pararhizobium sp. BT-229]MCV9963200.1 hypothetical protein [Pararhizobium sp. BT-229]